MSEAEAGDTEVAKWVSIRCERMTMREWFAGQVVQGLVSCVDIESLSGANGLEESAELADVAFRLADAMLERAKNPK